MDDIKSAKRIWLWIIGALLASAALKGLLLWMDVVPFNSDEAVVALMARHILQGERPIYFYGQAYMGSLDAYLIATGFAFLGQHVWVIRLIQAILYLGTLLTTALLGKMAFRSVQVGILAVWLMAIPVVNVTLYTTASLGGYGEALLIGNILLLLTLRIANLLDKQDVKIVGEWLAWGFFAGVGIWVFGLTLVYTIPAGIFLAITLYKANNVRTPLVLTIIGGVVGLAPWWGSAIQHGLAAPIAELGGSAIAGVEGISYLQQVGQHLINLILLGSMVIFGMRPPWAVTLLAIPLMPFALAIWAMVLIHLFKKPINTQAKKGKFLLWGVMLTVVVAFVFTPFGADPSGRYFLPLAVPLALYTGDWVVTMRDNYPNHILGRRSWVLVVMILAFNLWGTLQSALSNPPGLTTQFNPVTQVDQRSMPDLIAFLRKNSELSGYTNYWVAYPLAFLSDEELVYIPRLPYHQDFRYTRRDDRYLPYGEIVNRVDRVAYITTENAPLDDYLQERLSALGTLWKEIWIGDFHVFYELSEPVRPEDLGLEVTTP